MTYALYLLICIPLTDWVATNLHKNGRVFLITTFRGDELLAYCVNNLLRVGFYLVNLGFVAFYLKESTGIDNGQAVFEVLGTKIGFVLLLLGTMHFMNITSLTGCAVGRKSGRCSGRPCRLLGTWLLLR